MDIPTLKKNIKDKYLKLDVNEVLSDSTTPRTDLFLRDARRLWDNAITYNGPDDINTQFAESLYRIAEQQVQDEHAQLERLEMEIGFLTFAIFLSFFFF